MILDCIEYEGDQYPQYFFPNMDFAAQRNVLLIDKSPTIYMFPKWFSESVIFCPLKVGLLYRGDNPPHL